MELVGNEATEPVVVELSSVDKLPKLTQLSRAVVSPYAVMWLADEFGQMLCKRVSWPPRMGTREPTWNSACDLKPPAMPRETLLRSTLHLELWDYDAFLPHNLVSKAQVPLNTLVADEPVQVPLTPSALVEDEKVELKLSSEAVLTLLKRGVYSLGDRLEGVDPIPSPRRPVCYARVRLLGRFPLKKRLYVVRHGESLWNKGQSEANLVELYQQVDHPLSTEGRRQADTLNTALAAAVAGTDVSEDAADLKLMCSADAVWCSPLTRALQTLAVGMRTSLRERVRRVRLVANAREKRNHGSVDSIGCSVGGAEVRRRLVEKTTELYDGDAAVAEEVAGALGFDDAEVRSRWWSTYVEPKEEVAMRIGELLRQVRYCDDEVVVLVGHSHWFRELLKQQLSAAYEAREPEMARQLKKLKLSNCGVARFDLDFSAANAERPIIDVKLLAGSRLVK